MNWAFFLKLAVLVTGGGIVMLLMARHLALRAVRTAIERERADRAFDKAKQEEEARSNSAKEVILTKHAAEDARIDAMDAKEAEREINK